MSIRTVRTTAVRTAVTALVAAVGMGLAGIGPVGTPAVAAADELPAASPAATSDTDPAAGDAVEARAAHAVAYVTSGTRAREGDYPFPPYTATLDAEVSARAAELARRLAAGDAALTRGIQPVNAISTGWAHQREIVGRGTAEPGSASSYDTDLFGPVPTDGTPTDPRFTLMAGPKTHTAVGVARLPGTAEVVVVVVNGYATEPTVGGPSPEPIEDRDAGAGTPVGLPSGLLGSLES